MERTRSAAIVALLCAGVALAGVPRASGSAEPGPAPRSQEWVERRIAAWQPTERERRWESIGWAASLTEALRLARQHGRPVFLFTLDGRMGVGRC